MQKFIVYCRASSLITNDLPKRYPSSENEDLKFVQTYISSDLSGLRILKLNFFHSQQLFADEISDFFQDPMLKKFILVIDMQESSPDGINHVRMIIEELEPQVTVQKDILLLLHFPSPMFSNGIYPSLFLHGWNYRYIDSLALHAESGQIDIESWMIECVNKNLPHSGVDLQQNNTALENALQESITCELTPLITEFNSCKYINKEGIEKLLKNKEITTLLCKRFLDYFDVQLYTQYLSDAARVTQERESMINMKIQIEERVKENFFCYLKYVISLCHSHGVINAVLSDSIEAVFKYIRDLIPYIPVPESIMKLVKGTSFFKQSVMESARPFLCPFFSAILDEVESLIEQSRLKVLQNKEQLEQAQSQQRYIKSEVKNEIVIAMKEEMECTIAVSMILYQY